MNDKEKILSLQPLRAFAFLGVLLAHGEIIYLGNWGVSVFFVLSGFLFVYNYYDREMPFTLKNSIIFALKRIKKLYPLYICTLIALFPLSGYMHRSLCVNIKEFAIHFFLMQSLFNDIEMISRFNGSAWYLSSSMFIYLCIPFIVYRIKKYNNNGQPILVCIIGIALQIIFATVGFFDAYRFPMSRLVDVLVGCNLGYFFVKRNGEKEKNEKKKYTLYEAGAIMATFISAGIFFENSINAFWVLLPSTSSLVYLFAMQKGYISKILTNKVFIYLGDISQYGFLIHLVILRYMIVFGKHVLHVELDKWILFVGCFILTILCSEIWKYLEKWGREKIFLSKKH